MASRQHFARAIQPTLRAAAQSFSAVVLTGPRRSGKTYCLRQCFPDASYHLLEDPDVLMRLRADPQGWLDQLSLPAIVDEIQNAPEIVPYIRSRIDAAPTKKGQWLLTGSQDFSLMQGVSESMAGRAAILHLLPLSRSEIGRWDLVRGGYPEVWLRPRTADLWFRSYVQTYLERDVRQVTAVRDLATFRRFLGLVASRNGQLLNKSDLAAPLGVSVPTITQWLGVLETTGIVLLLPPYFESFGKRIVKTPKLYFTDSGLLCALLGLEDRAALERSPFIGSVFEAFVASEIVKGQLGRGQPRELYFFRDQQGLEVDFVIPHSGELVLVEAKWSRTPTPADARGLLALLEAGGVRRARGLIVHRGGAGAPAVATVAPAVKAIAVDRFLADEQTGRPAPRRAGAR